MSCDHMVKTNILFIILYITEQINANFNETNAYNA